MAFVNRVDELAALADWWDAPGGGMALLWGRRRVGKTALLQHFAAERPAIFHTAAGRPPTQELRLLSEESASLLSGGIRDLHSRPFTSWQDAIETLGQHAESEPLLLVLDEFPEAVDVVPELPSTLRAIWDRLRPRTRLKILLSGSAVRTTYAMQEQRAPLYGRFDLTLALHPFRPHEAALMLPNLSPQDRALVYSLVGGVPLYLELWDQRRAVSANLERLFCRPAARLLTEGELLLATEGELGDLGRQALFAIAAGKTKHSEIADSVGAEPTRSLERLMALRLIERVSPVTEDPARSRRRVYRVADNFLAFWLGVVDRYRAAIDRGLGHSILPVLLESLDDHVGPRWEDAFRMHLVRLANRGELGEGIVAIGPFWTTGRDAVEIDAVGLAGRSRQASLVGEATWTRRVDGGKIGRELERKMSALPTRVESPRIIVAARETVTNGADVLAITAGDIFDE